MYDIPTDMCVPKAYVHDFSTQQKPGVKAKRRAGCIAQGFRIAGAEKSNYGNASCYYAVRLHGPLRNKKKKSGRNSRDIFFAGRTAPIFSQSAKLLFKFCGP